MDALVLSGGSLKGSYQAGAVAELYATGFRPQIITGTSVGALNTGFLAAHHAEDDPGSALVDFWLHSVTSPNVVARRRTILELGWRVWRKHWAGMVDTYPLVELVHDVLGPSLPASGITARVCAVNLRTGAKVYVGADEPQFLEAVLASAAEPFLMPGVRVFGDFCVDGGLAEIAPLAEAIRLGATRIVCVVCQPERVSVGKQNWGDTCALVGRLTTIASNEIVNNDLRTCETINNAVRSGALPGKRVIEVTVIRPSRELPIALDRFGPTDIAKMIDRGRADARAVLDVRKAA